MRRICLTIAAVALVSFGVFLVLPAAGTARTADAADDWLKEMDSIAKQFRAEIVVVKETEEGERTESAVALEGPRRVIYYSPQTSELNPVFEGAMYAFHVNGNPEVIMAIENSKGGDNTNTYIEISRLSGAAIRVYRNDELAGDFPRTGKVEGAYVGMVK